MIFCQCPDTRPIFIVQKHSYSVCTAWGALFGHGYGITLCQRVICEY